jgi:hypothetical protein
MSNHIFQSNNERLLFYEIAEDKKKLDELTSQFIDWIIPGPKQRRLAKGIIELVRSILKKEEELVRIRKMSEEYSRRKS